MKAIRKAWTVRAGLFVLFPAVLVTTPAWTQQNLDSGHSLSGYKLASVCGDYGVVATYGANIARALGTLQFNGHGKFSGSAIANQPGPNDTRSIAGIELSGSYSVNTDGTGAMNVDVHLANGTVASVIEDFVITKVKWIKGIPVASEMVDAQKEPSAIIDDRGLVTHTYTLREVPDTCVR